MKGPSRSNKAEIIAVIGASGSGKTSYVMREIKRRRPRRLLVWDRKGEFAAEGYADPVENLGEVARMLVAAGRNGAFRIAYRPNGGEIEMRKHFDLFCRMAFRVKSLVLIAEELADVTTATHAVQGWREVTSQGRSEGLTVYGLTQQPASVDKHFFGNCSSIWCGRINFKAHLRTMASAMDVTEDEIRRLTPLHFYYRDLATGKTRAGKL